MGELIARLLLNAATARGRAIARCELALEGGRLDACCCGEHERIEWISARSDSGGARVERGVDWVCRPRAEVLRGL